MTTLLQPITTADLTHTSALLTASIHRAAQSEIRRFDPARILLVALDIGKDVHVLTLRSAAGHELLPPTQLDTLARGFASTGPRI